MTRGDFIQVSGLETTQEMSGLLGSLGSKIGGAYLKADQREGDIHNGDVVNFLAGRNKDGDVNPGHRGPIRDIRPTQTDGDQAARKYNDTVIKELDKITRKPKPLKTVNKASLEKAYKQGQMKASQTDAIAYKRAVKEVQ